LLDHRPKQWRKGEKERRRKGEKGKRGNKHGERKFSLRKIEAFFADI
jgi:hypothetical protein